MSEERKSEESLASDVGSLNIKEDTKEEPSKCEPKDKEPNTKIAILLKPAANAPIMKKTRWSVGMEHSISWVNEFFKKYLKLGPEEKLFLYVNQTFAPSPDHNVKDLYDCFGTDGRLVLHYCKTQAWG